MATDLNDIVYDAFLANDRTLADPMVVRVERRGLILLRAINASAASNFRRDFGTPDFGTRDFGTRDFGHLDLARSWFFGRLDYPPWTNIFQSTCAYANLKPMLDAARRFLILLIAFAIVGGTMEQRARSAHYIDPMTTAGMPCDMQMPAADTERASALMPGSEMPCKGMLTPDCAKQMGCITVPALPARLEGGPVAVRFSAVDYWIAWSPLAGVVHEPEQLPPRTT